MKDWIPCNIMGSIREKYARNVLGKMVKSQKPIGGSIWRDYQMNSGMT